GAAAAVAAGGEAAGGAVAAAAGGAPDAGAARSAVSDRMTSSWRSLISVCFFNASWASRSCFFIVSSSFLSSASSALPPPRGVPPPPPAWRRRHAEQEYGERHAHASRSLCHRLLPATPDPTPRWRPARAHARADSGESGD